MNSTGRQKKWGKTTLLISIWRTEYHIFLQFQQYLAIEFTKLNTGMRLIDKISCSWTFLFFCVMYICERRAFYSVNSVKLSSDHFWKEGKLQISCCRCLLPKVSQETNICGWHLLLNCANPTMALSRSDTV